MARQNTVNTKFTADGKEILSVLERIEGRLEKLSTTGSKNFSANFIQSADIIIQKLSQLGSAILDIAERGSGFALLQQEFEGLVSIFGNSSDKIIEKLKVTSKNAISERDLILATNRSILLGVADTEDELNKLLEISINRANKLGISATQAFNDIVTGLGRESALILDNLGIVIKLERVTEEYAKSLNKTADALTPVERKQALVNAVIKESENLLTGTTSEAEANAAKVASLTASWENLADSISKILSPSLAQAAEDLAKLLNNLDRAVEYAETTGKAKYFESLKNDLEELKDLDPEKVFSQTGAFENLFAIDPQSTVITGILQNMGKESASVGEIINYLNGELIKLDDTILGTSNTMVDYGVRVIEAANSQTELAKRQQEATQANQLFEEQTKLSSTSLSGMASATAYASDNLNIFENKLLSAQRANSVFQSSISSITNSIVSQAVKIQNISGTDIAESLGLDALDKLNFEIAKLEPNLENGELSALDLALTFGRIEDELLSPFKNLEEENKLAEQALKDTAKAGEDAASKIEQAFESLKGKVSGVLSSALSDDLGGIDLEEILGRQDSISEDARRLASVAAEGYNSEWFGYLSDKFPKLFENADDGNIKQVAASILKDFQDGLVPELIDKETAKERVRRALVGEQNLEDLATEIASELAEEFGTSLGSVQSLANSVLGIGGSGTGNGLKLPSPTLDDDALSSLPDQFEQSFNQTFDGMSERFSALLLDTFSAKVVLESSASAGRQNGESWGSGFLETVNDNIPAQLVDILTLAVLPRVENALAQSNNQEVSR